jgi:tetratricopeptide (TPR) repeat protein
MWPPASITWHCSTTLQGNYGDAEPLYQRALRIDETALGPDHPDVATSLNNLASLYRAQGNYDAAEPLLTARSENSRNCPRPRPS